MYKDVLNALHKGMELGHQNLPFPAHPHPLMAMLHFQIAGKKHTENHNTNSTFKPINSHRVLPVNFSPSRIQTFETGVASKARSKCLHLTHHIAKPHLVVAHRYLLHLRATGGGHSVGMCQKIKDLVILKCLLIKIHAYKHTSQFQAHQKDGDTGS